MPMKKRNADTLAETVGAWEKSGGRMKLPLPDMDALAEQERIEWMSIGNIWSGKSPDTAAWEDDYSIATMRENPGLMYDLMTPNESSWALVERVLMLYGPESEAMVDPYGRQQLGFVPKFNGVIL